MSDFAKLSLSPASLVVLGELGFAKPTAIQAAAIPALVAGADLVGRSPTGSGKTVAFALPMLERLDLRARRPQALVLCPTRELCAQVAGTVRTLGRRVPGLRVVAVTGGQPFLAQRHALEAGAHVVVGTPGRVLDHLVRGTFDPRALAVVVLDEADRMLDMGFADEMERVREALPEPRQTVLFSATFPDSIAALCAAWQRDPVHVSAGGAEERPPVRQLVHEVPGEGRLDALLALLRAEGPASALVFANLKTTVRALAEALADAGVSVAALHGDMEQPDRDRVMAQFRNGSKRVLVATDVAARGLDVAGLDLVVNVELPASPEAYVHRIGRTGRAGRPGLAVSFASRREREKLERIAREAGFAVELAPAPESGSTAPLDAPMETLRVAGGRRDKLRPGDVLGALTGDAGLSASDVGLIEIHDRFAFVAVARPVAERACAGLARIKGRAFRVERVR